MNNVEAKYYTELHSLKSEPTSRPEMPNQEPFLERVVKPSESKDDHRYAMESPRRGKAVIFNHMEFDAATGLRPRPGTDVDQKNLEEVLCDHEFDVTVNIDLTASEFLKKINWRTRTTATSLMVVVLTHGGDGGKLYARDRFYFLDELWKPFNAHNCPSLAGKPKIFIVQGCSGEKVVERVEFPCDSSPVKKRKMAQSYNMRSKCDFLIAKSFYEEFVTYRSKTYGTLYISNLCEVLQKHGKSLHFLKMLTKVARKVIFCQKVQMPCFVSNLTHEVFFLPKNA